LEEGCKESDRTHGRFCKKILQVPRFAAKAVAEFETGRDSRRGKVMSMVVKYWLRILHMEKEDLVRIVMNDRWTV
jgi:hypothetical protein